MSDFAVLDGSAPIRGGIPVCWPWFGPVRQPQHGTARTSIFKILSQKVSQKEISVELEFIDEEN